MALDIWLIYLAAAVGLSLTPGPNGLLSLTHGAQYGLRRTVATVLGGVTGFLLLIGASLAGLGALLAASEVAFSVLKWAGAAYLVYLGIRLWRAPGAFATAGTPDAIRPRQAGPLMLFRTGFLVAVSNPKALIFFAAFLPQFMQADVPLWLQFVILGGTFAGVELVYELMLAGTAQRIAPVLARSGRWFNRITGSAFIGIGAVLSTSSRAA